MKGVLSEHGHLDFFGLGDSPGKCNFFEFLKMDIHFFFGLLYEILSYFCCLWGNKLMTKFRTKRVFPPQFSFLHAHFSNVCHPRSKPWIRCWSIQLLLCVQKEGIKPRVRSLVEQFTSEVPQEQFITQTDKPTLWGIARRTKGVPPAWKSWFCLFYLFSMQVLFEAAVLISFLLPPRDQHFYFIFYFQPAELDPSSA